MDCHPHGLFLAHAGACRSAVGQDGLDPLAAAQHRQIALVGQYDGLGTTVCADHHRIGISTTRTKSGEERGQLRPCLSRRKYLVDTWTHEPIIAEGVHLWIHLLLSAPARVRPGGDAPTQRCWSQPRRRSGYEVTGSSTNRTPICGSTLSSSNGASFARSCSLPSDGACSEVVMSYVEDGAPAVKDQARKAGKGSGRAVEDSSSFTLVFHGVSSYRHERRHSLRVRFGFGGIGVCDGLGRCRLSALLEALFAEQELKPAGSILWCLQRFGSGQGVSGHDISLTDTVDVDLQPAPIRQPMLPLISERSSRAERPSLTASDRSPSRPIRGSMGDKNALNTAILSNLEYHRGQKIPAKPHFPAMGDTGLEIVSGARVRPDSPVLLAYGALRSAQVRSNCYQNCYQVRAVRGAGKDRSHASCSSPSSDAISADGGYLSPRESKRRGPAIGRISGRLRCGRRVLILWFGVTRPARTASSRGGPRYEPLDRLVCVVLDLRVAEVGKDLGLVDDRSGDRLGGACVEDAALQ